QQDAFNAKYKEFFLGGEAELPRKIAQKPARELPPVPRVSRSAVIAVVIFLTAHLALLIGLTTPDKFVFDEVHYVPAARQMLEPSMQQPKLNTVHAALAETLSAHTA